MKANLLTLAFGIFLVAGFSLTATAGPTVGGGDTDGDTVLDNNDNCVLDSNTTQTDSNFDGCGDVCSPGPSSASLLCNCGGNPAVVGGDDFGQLAIDWGSTTALACDCGGNGIVGGDDFGMLAITWGNTDGPSGIANQGVVIGDCGN
jgi:hypothetical protein